MLSQLQCGCMSTCGCRPRVSEKAQLVDADVVIGKIISARGFLRSAFLKVFSHSSYVFLLLSCKLCLVVVVGGLLQNVLEKRGLILAISASRYLKSRVTIELLLVIASN